MKPTSLLGSKDAESERARALASKRVRCTRRPDQQRRERVATNFLKWPNYARAQVGERRNAMGRTLGRMVAYADHSHEHKTLVSVTRCTSCGRHLPNEWRFSEPNTGRLTNLCMFTTVCEGIASGHRPDWREVVPHATHERTRSQASAQSAA